MLVDGGSVSLDGSTIVNCSGTAQTYVRSVGRRVCWVGEGWGVRPSARGWRACAGGSWAWGGVQRALPWGPSAVAARAHASAARCVQHAAGGMFVDGGSVSLDGSTIVSCSGTAQTMYALWVGVCAGLGRGGGCGRRHVAGVHVQLGVGVGWCVAGTALGPECSSRARPRLGCPLCAVCGRRDVCLRRLRLAGRQHDRQLQRHGADRCALCG